MKTLRKTVVNTVLVSGLLLSTHAFGGQTEINQIEQAASQMDLVTLNQYANDFEGYDLALAQYRLALTANLTQQTKVAKKAIDQAMETLESLEQTSPDDVEVKALLAQVYGYKIALEPIKGVYYGPKSQSKLEQAEQLAPNNPRVLLVKGIGALNTPAMFGGSVDVAMASFGKAISAYESDQYSNFYWGHAESYTWRGLMFQRQGDMKKAVADWKKAVEVEPGYGWAQSLLAQTAG